MMSRVLKKRFIRARAGNAAIEFALIAPVMILLAAGVYEIGRAFQSQSAVNKLASQYAIAWADCVNNPAGTCNTELGIYSPAYSISNLAPQLSNPTTVQMFQVVMSGTTPTVQYSSPANSTLTGAQSTAATAILSSGQTGVIVTVSYNHTLSVFSSVLSSIVPSTIPMTFTVVQLKA